MRVISLNGAVRFQISRLLIGCSDVFIRHSIGWILHSFQSTKYKLKIKLILKLIKRGDQALISIFTILKFSVLSWEFMNVGYRDYCWILSFFLISRLNKDCSPLVIISRLNDRTGLRISHSKSFQFWSPRNFWINAKLTIMITFDPGILLSFFPRNHVTLCKFKKHMVYQLIKKASFGPKRTLNARKQTKQML